MKLWLSGVTKICQFSTIDQFNMSRGVVIIATGHENYIKMAFNLALSIKVADNDAMIHLVTTIGNIDKLTKLQLSYFESYTELEPKEYTLDGKEQHFYTKTRLYELSPFDETIYIDCDSIWLPKQKTADLFNKFKSVDFGFITYNENEVYPITSEKSVFWNKEGECINDLNKYFTFKKGALFYHIQSSFLYFKKTEKAKAIFECANERFAKKDFGTREWANGMGDEFAFSISLALNNYKVKTHYQDIFYYPLNQQSVNLRDRKTLYSRFFFFSLAGNRMTSLFKDFYNEMVLWNYCQRGNLVKSHRYNWIDKANYLTERKQF